MATNCRCCNSNKLTEVLNLGEIPIAHKMSKHADQAQPKHPMILHVCEDCALIQILNPVDPKLLYTDYNFCFSNWKPQPHMADELKLIQGYMQPNELMVEVGSNDGTFLKLASDNGYHKLAGIEPNPTLNEIARKTKAQIYEGFYNSDINNKIKNQFGEAKIVISRQVVEHITDLSSLMKNIRDLLSADGLIMFEVPNFEIPMQYGDCSSLWEEHVNYFTEHTLTGFLNRWGFKVVETKQYDFSGGALFVVAQKQPQFPIDQNVAGKAETLALAKDYKQKIVRVKDNLKKVLVDSKNKGFKNALYGAGCRANMFLHGLGLSNLFDLVIDDQAEKQGHYFPGTQLKILPSSELRALKTSCFLSVNYENEKKVLDKSADLLKTGSKFYSVNSPSPSYKESFLNA